jgi:hypothetical protein
MSHIQLTDELCELGRTVPPAPGDPDALTERIMARVRSDDVPVPDSGTTVTVRRHGRRRVLAVAAAVLLALALTTPVRAAVLDWFGVIVRPGPPAEQAAVPGVEPALNIEQATGRVGFDPVVPAELGQPDGIDVTSDGRVLSMSWSAAGGTIRLDQFDGLLAPVFAKQASAEQLDIGGRLAVWFDGPHYLTALDEFGLEYAGSARPAGPTLVWEHAGVTLRLEGADRSQAIRIAGDVMGTG